MPIQPKAEGQMPEPSLLEFITGLPNASLVTQYSKSSGFLGKLHSAFITKQELLKW
jgi:hypothetical protein